MSEYSAAPEQNYPAEPFQGGTAAEQNQPIIQEYHPPEQRAQIPFERRIGLLEEIVARLERGDVPLADSLSLFEEGTKLIAACSQQLDQAEQQVVKLMKGQDGAPVEQPFEDAGEA